MNKWTEVFQTLNYHAEASQPGFFCRVKEQERRYSGGWCFPREQACPLGSERNSIAPSLSKNSWSIFPCLVRQKFFSEIMKGLPLLNYGFFSTFAFFFLPQGYIHGICRTNWKQNFWYLIQSAFPHMLASSEGLKLSPACGQCKLQLHFKIRTKYGVPMGSVSPRQDWVHCLCIHLFKTVLELFLNYVETTASVCTRMRICHTHRHTHRGVHKLPRWFSIKK